MHDDDAKLLVDRIIETLPDLVKETIENYRQSQGYASLEIQMRWQMLILMVKESAGLWPDADYQRFSQFMEEALREVEAAMNQIDANTPADDAPASTYWTTEELKQFTKKGA